MFAGSSADENILVVITDGQDRVERNWPEMPKEAQPDRLNEIRNPADVSLGHVRCGLFCVGRASAGLKTLAGNGNVKLHDLLRANLAEQVTSMILKNKPVVRLKTTQGKGVQPREKTIAFGSVTKLPVNCDSAKLVIGSESSGNSIALSNADLNSGSIQEFEIRDGKLSKARVQTRLDGFSRVGTIGNRNLRVRLTKSNDAVSLELAFADAQSAIVPPPKYVRVSVSDDEHRYFFLDRTLGNTNEFPRLRYVINKWPADKATMTLRLWSTDSPKKPVAINRNLTHDGTKVRFESNANKTTVIEEHRSERFEPLQINSETSVDVQRERTDKLRKVETTFQFESGKTPDVKLMTKYEDWDYTGEIEIDRPTR